MSVYFFLFHLEKSTSWTKTKQKLATEIPAYGNKTKQKTILYK